MDEKLLTLIGRERATGCRDAAVFGGFGSFVAELGDPGLASLGGAYAAAPLDQRPELLDAMEQRVKRLLAGEDAERIANREDDLNGKRINLAGCNIARHDIAAKGVDEPLYRDSAKGNKTGLKS